MPAIKKKLVIVESPTKARTISRFLDSNYIVEACMGHIRDLPESAKDIPEKYKKKPWKNLGVNVDSKFEPIYCVPKSKSKIVTALKKQLKTASELILATDEDREGESISWHLYEVLKPKIPVKRIVFHEITKEAIHAALKNYRSVDKNLVQAQEARRILDRLVGYSISPLLWKKITMGLSAGRVQSVAIKLISEKELERMNFVISSYCNIEADLALPKSDIHFDSHLHSWKSQKIASGKDFANTGKLKSNKLLHLKEKDVKLIINDIGTKQFVVNSIEKKPISRSPKPPFITSTLQQVANRTLHLSPSQTMSIAQKLYEKGLITYMRTDSTSLSKEAINGIRKAILNIYGSKNLPKTARFYKTKSKAAQEAHEAIRPAGQKFKSPDQTGLSHNELKLYQLIWQRAIACQMNNCEQEQTNLEVTAGEASFRASGQIITSPGFYLVYKDKNPDDKSLPHLKKSDKLNCLKLIPKNHKTKAPARYNAASLIQKLESEGIGRPSTYAPVITTIQNRGYVKKTNQYLAPTFTAIAVTKLLSEHLPDFVNLTFTSNMEKKLDDMAIGKGDYVKYLSSIYHGKTGLKHQIALKEKTIDASLSRVLKFDSFKNINFHVGRFGAYITQQKNKKELKASLPEELFLSDVTNEKLQEILNTTKKKDKVLGIDPKTNKKIFIKTGRYGPYLELEELAKRASIPKFISPENISLDQALKLLELPKVLGLHPKTKKEVKKSIGRFGPYVVHDGDFRSVPEDEKFLSLDFKQAMDILAQEKKKSSRSSKAALKEFSYQDDTIKILQGYSPYIKFKNKNYKLPTGSDALKLSLQDVIKIITESKPKSKSKTKTKSKSKKIKKTKK